ncbi:NUDIX hydrolase [Vreelandella sp. TE19]
MRESAVEGEAEPVGEACQVLRIAAAMMIDEAGRLLLVRKQGSRYFMQPGGKVEPNEACDVALCRELQEELGLCVEPSRLTHFKRVRAVAANEAQTLIDAELYSLAVEGHVEAAAEIAEARWVSPAQAKTLLLAPLTRDCVVPWADARLSG